MKFTDLSWIIGNIARNFSVYLSHVIVRSTNTVGSGCKGRLRLAAAASASLSCDDVAVVAVAVRGKMLLGVAAVANSSSSSYSRLLFSLFPNRDPIFTLHTIFIFTSTWDPLLQWPNNWFDYLTIIKLFWNIYSISRWSSYTNTK